MFCIGNKKLIAYSFLQRHIVVLNIPCRIDVKSPRNVCVLSPTILIGDAFDGLENVCHYICPEILWCRRYLLTRSPGQTKTYRQNVLNLKVFSDEISNRTLAELQLIFTSRFQDYVGVIVHCSFVWYDWVERQPISHRWNTLTDTSEKSHYPRR